MRQSLILKEFNSFKRNIYHARPLEFFLFKTCVQQKLWEQWTWCKLIKCRKQNFSSNGTHVRARRHARENARAIQNRIFASDDFDFTRSQNASIWWLECASKAILTVPNKNTDHFTHHTSISCKSDGYFKFWKKLKFQKYCKNRLFFSKLQSFDQNTPTGVKLLRKSSNYKLT